MPTNIVFESFTSPVSAGKRIVDELQRRKSPERFGDDDDDKDLSDLGAAALLVFLVFIVLIVGLWVWATYSVVKWFKCGLINGVALAVFFISWVFGAWPIGFLFAYVVATSGAPGTGLGSARPKEETGGSAASWGCNKYAPGAAGVPAVVVEEAEAAFRRRRRRR